MEPTQEASMQREWMGMLAASAFILASGVPAIAATEPPVEPSARMVEIPGAGAVVRLPRGWRTWLPEGYHYPQVRTTDPATGWTCALWLSGELASAASAADAMADVPEAADMGISRGEPFETPVGTAVLVTYGGREAQQPPAYVVHEAYVKVDEEGTEAAAATAVVMKGRSAPSKPRVVRADHPF